MQRSPEDFPEGDIRGNGFFPKYAAFINLGERAADCLSRFSKENFPKILNVVDRLQEIGNKHGATSGQIALSWILAQGEDFVVIPGTKSIKVRHLSLVRMHCIA